MNKENIIEIHNLKKNYDNGNVKALNGINLEIKKGEFISIMGPSGSGKSTLLNMIGALDRAEEGKIEVAGINLMETSDLSEFRSKEIGFVFQMHNLIPNLSVLENVEIPMYEGHLKSQQMRERHGANCRASRGRGRRIPSTAAFLLRDTGITTGLSA